jgi:dienelactone hydrolase
MRNLILAVAALVLTETARAEVKTQTVEYKQGDTTLQGFIAWDDATNVKIDRGGVTQTKRPGVLVIHEWWGHNEHARNQAIRLAKAGYVGFAIDMYGKGKVAAHPKDAEAFMTEATKDPAIPKARFEAALAELKKNPNVDPEKIAAMGYCFGGNVALRMARAGADLDAVSTFHASLAMAGSPVKKGAVKARILVNTGAADPMIPADQVEAFKKEMTDAGAKIQVISYPGAKHSFTNPDADKAGMAPLAYSAEADTKSFEATLKMFGEVFPTPPAQKRTN